MHFRKLSFGFVFWGTIFGLALLFVLENHHSSSITCIRVSRTGTPAETLGALYRTTQLAFFLSSQLSAKLSIDSHSAFSRCPPAKPSCHLDERALVIPRCSPGDCACYARRVAPYLDALSHCDTVQVSVDERSTSEFSGCTRDSVRRYVAPQHGTYAVLVFSGPGVADLPNDTAKYMQRQLCRLSSSDVVVIADSVRDVPICPNRTVLAAGLDDAAVVSLIAGARTVAARGGANVHMGVAGMTGGRLILPAEEIPTLDWAPVQDFTVIGMRGTVFHFDSADLMRSAVAGSPPSSALSRAWSLRMEGDVRADPTVFVWETPQRRWAKR